MSKNHADRYAEYSIYRLNYKFSKIQTNGISRLPMFRVTSLHSWRSKFIISNRFANQVSPSFIEYKLNLTRVDSILEY